METRLLTVTFTVAPACIIAGVLHSTASVPGEYPFTAFMRRVSIHSRLLCVGRTPFYGSCAPGVSLLSEHSSSVLVRWVTAG